MPSNLIPSNQIDMAFVDYFSPASAACDGDFNKLFVPFRCIGTDALNRREIVFRSGDLGKAIRTSMTIPLVFRPIPNDSTILYDGGLYNNFPFQVLQSDFRPDVLIGSKCVEGSNNPDENSLMDQVFALTMLHTDYNLPEGNSVMIDRIFKDVSMLDFSRSAYIIQCGYDDTMLQMDSIKRLVHRRVDTTALAARRTAYTESLPPLIFGDYDLVGLNSHQRDYVRNELKLNRKGQIYSFDQFRYQYFKILSEGEIEGFYPDVTYNDSTHLFSLSMRMRTKPSLKLMIGGNISSTALNQAYVGLEYKTIRRSSQSYSVDGYFSPFYTSAVVRARTDLFAWKRFPLYYEYGYIYNYYNYFRSNYGRISKINDLTYAKDADSYFNVAFGTPVSHHSVINLAVNGGWDTYRYFQSSDYDDADTMDRTRFRCVGAKFEFDRRIFNYVLYPTRGTAESMSLIFVNGHEIYTPGTTGRMLGQPAEKHSRYWFGAHYSREQYFWFKRPKWFSFGILGDITVTSHPNFTNAYATNISSPAFTPTVHSKIVYMKEFRSPSYIGLGILPTFEFTPKAYLRTSAFAFLPENYDGVKEGIRQRLRYIFDASFVYQTLVGPVSLSLSKYDVSANNWFITFNFGYAIFNRKGLFY